MKFTVKITPEANLEESEAYSYYETIRPGLGDEFLDTLMAHYDKLQQKPILLRLYCQIEFTPGCRYRPIPVSDRLLRKRT
jgi:hypothetical protein